MSDRVKIWQPEELRIAYSMLARDFSTLCRSIPPFKCEFSVLLTGTGFPASHIEIVNIFELYLAVRTEIG